MKKIKTTIKQTNAWNTLFVLGLLVGGCFCFWNKLEDASLLPRIFFVAAWLLFFSPVAYKIFMQAEIKFHLADAAFLLYVVMHFLSIVQCINKPEGVFASEKIFLAFFCYLVFRVSLQQKIITEVILLKGVALVCSVYFIFSLFQLLNLIVEGKASGDYLYAITGLTGHKNLYSCFLFLTSIFLLIIAITERGLWKMFCMTLIAAQLTMIFVLQTRSIFLALAISSFVSAAISIWVFGSRGIALIKKIVLPLILVLVAVILFYAFTGNLHSFLDRFNIFQYADSATGAERRFVWYKCRMMIHDHWLVGVGAGNWMLIYPSYSINGLFRSQYLNTVFLQPHNDFLGVWCELGIGGLLALLTLFVFLLLHLVKKIRQQKVFQQQLIHLLLFAQLIGFLVFSYFDFPKERMELQMLLVLSLAIIATRIEAGVKVFTLKRKYASASIVLCYLIIGASALGLVYKMKSDSLTKKLLAAKERGDNKSVLLLAQLMQNPFSNLTPLSVPHKWYEGVAAYELKQYQEAYDCFSIAKTQAPYNHNVLNNLGALEGYYQHYDKALNYFHESLRIDNKNDDTRFNVAYMLYQLKRYDEAIDTVRKVWSNEARKQEFIRVISASRDSIRK